MLQHGTGKGYFQFLAERPADRKGVFSHYASVLFQCCHIVEIYNAPVMDPYKIGGQFPDDIIDLTIKINGLTFHKSQDLPPVTLEGKSLPEGDADGFCLLLYNKKLLF